LIAQTHAAAGVDVLQWVWLLLCYRTWFRPEQHSAQ